jgi:hypothetical protein
MRKDFETPIDFASSTKVNGYLITYSNLIELSQGGPAIGRLSIDSEQIGKGSYFGGPLLFDENYIYIPIYIKNFFSSGFKLASVGLKSKALKIITQKKTPLIFLESLDDGFLSYYEDMGQTKLVKINIASPS